MQAERDKVVHWLWSEDSLQRPGVMDWHGGDTRNKWNVDYGRLQAIALKADGINTGFMQLMFRYGMSEDGKSGLLSVAWQRICGIQRQNG